MFIGLVIREPYVFPERARKWFQNCTEKNQRPESESSKEPHIFLLFVFSLFNPFISTEHRSNAHKMALLGGK